MSEINVNITEEISDEKQTETLTSKELIKLRKDYMNFRDKNILKSVFFSLLIVVAWVICTLAIAYGFSISEISGVVQTIVAYAFMAIGVIVLVLVNLFTYKRIKKKRDEFKMVVYSNPEATKDAVANEKRSIIIRLVICGVLLFIILAFINVAFPDNSSTVKCSGCDRDVDRVITNSDAAGVMRTWCQDCWDDYNYIMY